jgi:aspartyl-tRNA(Asn)/glutamyl-tRNA(Gln) amidotransferase subunit A
MTIDRWLDWARADAAARGLPELVPLLETLANATRVLRGADWNRAPDQAGTPEVGTPGAPQSIVWDPDTHPVPDADTSSFAGGRTVDWSGVSRSRQDATTGGADRGAAPAAMELQPITTLRARLARGDVSAQSLVDACLARIERANPALNAMVVVLADRAREQAAAADARRARGRLDGPLHGLPITLKDLIDCNGTPTSAASRVRGNLGPARDAPVTERLRAAGAILVGKTNLHEFAFGTTNEDSAFGPARHPNDPKRSPGGSSGGSAAAIVAGMCVASIGTDTGGSIRIPAAACGLVGLKGGFGEVPTAGVVPLAASLDHVGPLARSVEDAWLLWHVLSGHPAPPGAGAAAPSVKGLRLVLLEPYFCDLLQDGVRRAFASALDVLRGAGAHVRRGAMPHASLTAAVYLHTVMAEAAAYHGPTLERRPEDYTAPVRVRLEMGRYVLGEDYVRAMRGRDVLRQEVDALLEAADALVLPTLPIAAPPLGATTVMVGDRPEPVRALTLRLTQLFDVTGHPAISIPVGDAEPGLPAGLQLVGRRGGTRELLQAALACERALAG